MTLRPLRPDPSKDPTLDVELALMEQFNLPRVIGLDEVGRGAVAGPVAVGAHVVTCETGDFPAGLRDSKLISEKRREALIEPIGEWGVGAVGYAEAPEIDERGITAMLGEAARRALLELHGLGVPVDRSVILLDGTHDWLTPALLRPLRVVTRAGADRACASVAAASVRAKVGRDRLMTEAHEKAPHYGWATNKGYAAPSHLQAIQEFGASALHRLSWLKHDVSAAATGPR